MRIIKSTLSLIFVWTFLHACSSGRAVTGNEGGSEPVNEKEVMDYKRALHRCYKTGGARIVKIAGELRCFN